jgi:K+-sensing histidine kinase KdpD
MFSRANTSTSVTNERAGIGLLIYRLQLVKMSGRIGFETSEGEGAAIWIELPSTSS